LQENIKVWKLKESKVGYSK